MKNFPYYRVINGRGFWGPTPEMRRYGFKPVACGEDGPAARATAAALFEKWQECRKDGQPSPQILLPRKSPKKTTPNMNATGYVYFYRVGDFIKIGFSVKPITRIQELQTAQAATPDMMFAVRGTRSQECDLHSLFSRYRKAGEWFRACPQITAKIARIASLGHISQKEPLGNEKLEIPTIAGLANYEFHHGALHPVEILNEFGERDGT